MPVVHHTPFIRLHHHPIEATLETEWLGFVNSNDLRTTLNEALRLGRHHRVQGWVANNVLLRAIRPADQDWINEVWFPEFARLKVQRLAIVESQDGLNRMGINTIIQRATAHVPYDLQYFAQVSEARRWAGGISTRAFN